MMFKKIIYKLNSIIYRTGEHWDAMSPTEQTAKAFASECLNDEPAQKDFNTNEFSLEYCLAASAQTINDRFRLDSPCRKDIEISNMLYSYTTKKDIVVYRGVCSSVYDKMIENAKHVSDVDFVEKGFLATSLVKGRELKSDFNFRIYIPAGTHAIYMGDVNKEEKIYYEVDIQRNAHLKIVSIDKHYINCKLIRTETDR